MTEISNYIDGNGNFTHTKVIGTKEQILTLIDKYKESNHFKNMTDSQRILMDMYVFPRMLETGMTPQEVLLELVMPSTSKGFGKLKAGFDDLQLGATIKFDLPPRFKPEGKE